ncbi:MAG: HAD-IA family hydrolase [Acidobacteria bacterium]|nr:HAD-IA family hydrolase [Acidobacteriota bacterium]
MNRILVFDMDGVLVDVGESYRETIQRTVEHFTGRRVTRETIQEWKNRGGWNDDWALSTAMIRTEGVEVDSAAVVDYFKRLFLGGDGQPGLILRERWVAREGLFERLGRGYRLAVFTGRPRKEAELTLNRFAAGLRFDPIVGSDAVANHKPAPDGLLHIAALCPGSSLWYVGDTVDDARCARAAGVPFIGIASPSNPRRAELVGLFEAENSIAVLEDINQLESGLP